LQAGRSIRPETGPTVTASVSTAECDEDKLAARDTDYCERLKRPRCDERITISGCGPSGGESEATALLGRGWC